MSDQTGKAEQKIIEYNSNSVKIEYGNGSCPALDHSLYPKEDYGYNYQSPFNFYYGLSSFDYFFGLAMQAILPRIAYKDTIWEENDKLKFIVEKAYKIAKMMEEKKNEKSN